MIDPETGTSIPDDLVDALLDGDLDTRSSREVFETISRNPEKAREIVSTQWALEALRRPVNAPDLTSSILAAVDRRRRWLHPAARVRLLVSRYAAVVVFLMMVAGAFVLQRVAPEATTITHERAPIGHLADAVHADAADAFRSLPQTVGDISRVIWSSNEKSDRTPSLSTRGPGARVVDPLTVMPLSVERPAPPIQAAPTTMRIERVETRSTLIPVVAPQGTEDQRPRIILISR